MCVWVHRRSVVVPIDTRACVSRRFRSDGSGRERLRDLTCSRERFFKSSTKTKYVYIDHDELWLIPRSIIYYIIIVWYNTVNTVVPMLAGTKRIRMHVPLPLHNSDIRRPPCAHAHIRNAYICIIVIHTTTKTAVII